MNSDTTLGVPDDYTTLEVARLLGMSVRSVQLMVDRGELEAWKTPGGHRRIARASVERWRKSRTHVRSGAAAPHAVQAAGAKGSAGKAGSARQPCVLLIDDSIHFQKLISLLVRKRFPEIDLHVADDGIAGLALYGQLQPQVLIVDILLPGIDGATLITSLRSHSQFAHCHLVVVTSLDEGQRTPYAFALEQVPVIHKPRLVAELPAMLASWLPARRAARGTPGRPT
jgi:excisionase family DNA binding protein